MPLISFLVLCCCRNLREPWWLNIFTIDLVMIRRVDTFTVAVKREKET